MGAIMYVITVLFIVCLSTDKHFIMPQFLKAQTVVFLFYLISGKIDFDFIYTNLIINCE